tara:strand:- start:14852 stop:15454 length:603 start_codon:yes stop_codon:yes gene_type:complete
MINRDQLRVGNISTSEKEVVDIIKAWVAISLAFGILLRNSFAGNLYYAFIVSSITVGIGFLLHELAHKIVAQRFGCFAEFRSFDNMLIIAIVMSFFGFLFAAPGAVMISGKVTRKTNGIISVAGPIVNILLAILFLIGSFSVSGILTIIFSFGFTINSLLALFNMIPILNFDGAKVLKWNKLVYFTTLGISILLYFSAII